MKKIFTLICAAVAAYSLTAQADIKQWLSKITCTYGFETTEYFYNENNLVQKRLHMDWSYALENHADYYSYDDNGNVTRIAEYQDVFEFADETEFIPVNYVDYKYNTLNQMTERIPYNNYDAKSHPDRPMFQLASVQAYEYNMDGKLAKVSTYWDLEKNTLFQEDRYVYDANGLLIRRNIFTMNFENQLVQDACVNYVYDAGDQLIEMEQCEYDASTSTENPIYCLVYTWDTEGNLVKQEKTTPSKNTVNQKFEYEYYDSTYPCSVAEVAYPLDPEEIEFTDLYKNLKHVLKSYKEYDTDLNTNTLQLYDEFNLNYADAIPVSGVQKIEAARPDSKGMTFAGVNGGILRLNGINAMENVRIYDLQGRVVMNTTYSSNGINVNELPAGAYVISTANGVAKFVK